jgi:acyl carrier protein
MQKEQIESGLKEYLIDECGLDDNLGNDSDIFGPGLLDSIEVLNILKFIEQKFDTQFSTFEVSFDNFENINKITELILEKNG